MEPLNDRIGMLGDDGTIRIIHLPSCEGYCTAEEVARGQKRCKRAERDWWTNIIAQHRYVAIYIAGPENTCMLMPFSIIIDVVDRYDQL